MEAEKDSNSPSSTNGRQNISFKFTKSTSKPLSGNRLEETSSKSKDYVLSVDKSEIKRRRKERENIGEIGVPDVWACSPKKISDSDEIDTEDEKKRKKNKIEKKHKKKSKEDKKSKKENKSKKEKKSKKVKFTWVEKKKVDDEREVVIGPPPPKTHVQLSVKDCGKALLPGEGLAMAGYVEKGLRIPRRGEIGLNSKEIEAFEAVGFVMSGSRHRRMEAVRLRKESQIYSADEKRALAQYSKDQRQNREKNIISQFEQLLKLNMNS